jgi:hypothetical protein
MTMKLDGVARRLGRLFVIRTRWEAWAVTWAIALGAAERGKHYLALYPGMLGWVFFAICCAVVFVAGAKLLDATKSAPAVVPMPAVAGVRRPALAPVKASSRRLRPLSRSRPRVFRPDDGSRSRFARRTD